MSSAADESDTESVGGGATGRSARSGAKGKGTGGRWVCMSFREKCRERFRENGKPVHEHMLQPCNNEVGKRRCKIDEIVRFLDDFCKLEFGDDIRVVVRAMRDAWSRVRQWKNSDYFLDPLKEPPPDPKRMAKKEPPVEQYRKAVHPDYCVRWGSDNGCDQRNVRKRKATGEPEVPPACAAGAQGYFQCLKIGTKRAVKLLLNVEEPPMFGSFLVTFFDALEHWLGKYDPGFAAFKTRTVAAATRPWEGKAPPPSSTGKAPPPPLQPPNKFGPPPPGKIGPPPSRSRGPVVRRPLGKDATPAERAAYEREFAASPDDITIVPYELLLPTAAGQMPPPAPAVSQLPPSKKRKTGGKDRMPPESRAQRTRRREQALNKLSSELQILIARKGKRRNFVYDWVHALHRRILKWKENEDLFDPTEEDESDENSPFKELWQPANCVKWGRACSQRKRYEHARSKKLVPALCDTLEEGTAKMFWSYRCLMEGAKKTLKVLDSRNPPGLGPFFYYAQRAAETWLKKYPLAENPLVSGVEDDGSDDQSDESDSD
jgi:hypothetical protein